MSWWEISGGAPGAPLYLGDETADAVEEALLALAKAREAAGQCKPRPEELRAAFAGSAAPSDVTEAVARATAGVHSAMEQRFGRRAVVDELAAAFEFVVRPEPEAYLDAPAGHDFRVR